MLIEQIFARLIFSLAVATTPVTTSVPEKFKVIEQSPEIKSQVEKQRTLRVEAISAFALGKKFEEEGKLDEALKSYEKASQADADYMPIKLAKAQVLFALDRTDEALKILEKLPQNMPEVTSLLAWGYFKKEKKSERVMKLIDQTFEQIKTASSKDSSDYLRWGFRLALLLLKCNTTTAIDIAKKLLPVFEKAASLDPRNPQVQLLAAEIALHANDFEKALAYYEKVNTLAPNTPNVRQRLALFFALTDQKEKAIEILEKVLEESPDQKSLYPLLGELYERTGNFQKAEDNYMLALKLGAPSSGNDMRLALLYLRNKKPEKALEILDEGAKKFPTLPQIPFLRGIALRDTGRLVEALDAFSLAEATSSNNKDFLNTDFYFEYGITANKAGKQALAEKYLKKAIDLDPKNHVAMNYLGYSWADQNERLPEAEKLLNQALALEPDEPAYHDSMGWIYYREGRFQDAEKEIFVAAQKMPDDPEVNEHLGDVYEKLKDLKKAQEYWRKALAKATDEKQIERLKKKTATPN